MLDSATESVKVSGRWWMNQEPTNYFIALDSIWTVGMSPIVIFWMAPTTRVLVVLAVIRVQPSTVVTVPAVVTVPCFTSTANDQLTDDDEFHLLWFLLATGSNIYLH